MGFVFPILKVEKIKAIFLETHVTKTRQGLGSVSLIARSEVIHVFFISRIHLCFNKGADAELNPSNIDWPSKKKEIIKVD